MKKIHYYFSPPSPWSYMGHDRLLAMAKKHGAMVEPRPFALNSAVFPVSGGLPLKQRAPQRQAYRLLELRRWADYLGLPLNVNPKYFPVSDELASLMVCAAIQQAGNQAALDLLRSFYLAVWVDQLNIADVETLIDRADDLGLNGQGLYDVRDQARALYDRNTQEAIDAQIFGAPWYVYNGEPFWGQDRLDFLERSLADDA